MANRADRMVDLFRVGFAAGNKVGGWIDESRGRADKENLLNLQENAPQTTPEMFGQVDTSVPAPTPQQIQAPPQPTAIPTQGMSPAQPESRMTQAASSPAQIQSPAPAPGGIPQQSPTTDAQMRQAQVDRPDTTEEARRIYKTKLVQYRDDLADAYSKVGGRMEPKEFQTFKEGYAKSSREAFSRTLGEASVAMRPNPDGSVNYDPMDMSKKLTQAYATMPGKDDAIFTPNPDGSGEVLGTFYDSLTGKIIAPGVAMTPDILENFSAVYAKDDAGLDYREAVEKQDADIENQVVDNLQNFSGGLVDALSETDIRNISTRMGTSSASNAKAAGQSEKQYGADNKVIYDEIDKNGGEGNISTARTKANAVEFKAYNQDKFKGNPVAAVALMEDWDKSITTGVGAIVNGNGEIPQTAIDAFALDPKYAGVDINNQLNREYNQYQVSGQMGPVMKSVQLSWMSDNGYLWRAPAAQPDGTDDYTWSLETGDYEAKAANDDRLWFDPTGRANGATPDDRIRMYQVPPSMLGQNEYKTGPGQYLSYLYGQSGMGQNGYISTPGAGSENNQLINAWFRNTQEEIGGRLGVKKAMPKAGGPKTTVTTVGRPGSNATTTGGTTGIPANNPLNTDPAKYKPQRKGSRQPIMPKDLPNAIRGAASAGMESEEAFNKYMNKMVGMYGLESAKRISNGAAQFAYDGSIPKELGPKAIPEGPFYTRKPTPEKVGALATDRLQGGR